MVITSAFAISKSKEKTVFKNVSIFVHEFILFLIALLNKYLNLYESHFTYNINHSIQ